MTFPDLHAEAGFTLIEMLVSTVCALIVAFAGFALFDTTFEVSGEIFDRVDATQLGRDALSHIEQELHSACVASGVTPIRAGSTSTSVSFISTYGSAAVLTPVLHDIAFANGSLTDTSYQVSGGTTPNWTFSSTASAPYTIDTDVSQASSGVPATAQPVFSYYSITSAGTLSASPLATPLTAATAPTAVAIAITFVAGPSSSGDSGFDLPLTLQDEVVLRLSPPTSTSTAPCV